MRVTGIMATNFRAFEELLLDKNFLSKDKYLFVGKNGSGKTTVLEAVRLGLTLNNSTSGANQHYFTFLRDNTKPAHIEISLELDDEEMEICKRYLDSLISEGAPTWNSDDKKRYDIEEVDRNIISRVVIRPDQSSPFTGSARSATFDETQSFISARTDSVTDSDGASARRFHIIRKLMSEHREQHRPFIYLSPFRAVQITEPQVFSNFGVIQQVMSGSPGQQVNDPVMGANANAPEYAKTYYQYNYNYELYAGVIAELYKLAITPETKKSLEIVIQKEMANINEMIAPKAIKNINIDKDSNLVFYEVTDGDITHPISSMSAGEDQLVIFGLTLPRYLNMGKDYIKPLVLIDEPEVHLHPEFSKRLGTFLEKKLTSKSKQQLMIASHSVEIIQTMSDSAYQVSSKGIMQLDDVETRAAVFNETGSSFSIADLVTKVVFVEGREQATKLQDCEFYRKLIDDPFSRRARFIGIGGKSSVWKIKTGGDEWQNFVKSQVGKPDDNGLLAILDGDVLNWTRGIDGSTSKAYRLPAYSFESLLYQPKVITRAFNDRRTLGQVNAFFRSSKEELITHTRDNKILGEYDYTNAARFNMGGGYTQADLEARFAAKLQAFLQERSSLQSDYYIKAKAAVDWYLHVDGKRLRTKVIDFLGIRDGNQVDSKLLEAVRLTDMPASMQQWFKDTGLAV